MQQGAWPCKPGVYSLPNGGSSRPSSQNATAAAAATFSESTPRRIGSRTRTSLALCAAPVNPGPSAPNSNAARARWAGESRWIGRASAAGVNASTVKPASRTCSSPSGQRLNLAYGTAKTSPMLTRTLRR